jgi:hypothetical protein
MNDLIFFSFGIIFQRLVCCKVKGSAGNSEAVTVNQPKVSGNQQKGT